MLRRLNEEWGTAVVLAEHRLERCLPAADRVLALEDGAVACDAAPAEFLAWAAGERAGELATPVARLFSLAGLGPLPASVKEARAALRDAGPGAGGPGAGDGRTAARAAASAGAATAPRPRCELARRLARARRRPDGAARPGPAADARRARGADGAQRRRQEHAAARREGARGAHARARRARRRGRPAAPEPGRLPDPRARRGRGGRRRARRRRAGGPRRSTPARPLRRRAPAAGAGGRARRRDRPRRCCSTSRPAAWTARTRTRWPTRIARAGRRGRRGRRGDARHRVRRQLRRRAWC